MKEVKGKRTVTIPEVKDILEGLDPETIDQLQKRTKDYAEKFAKVDTKAAQKAIEKLVDECGLTGEEAAEVVNVLPRGIPELRVFAAGWKKLITTENLEKMLRILKEAS